MFSNWLYGTKAPAPEASDALPDAGATEDLEPAPGIETASSDLKHIFWAEHLTDAQKSAVKSLRARLEEGDGLHPLLSTDTDLTRFLMARKFNVDATYKMCESFL